MCLRILITGAAGFIGSHAAEAFLARGDEVLGVDNFNDFYDPQVKRANAECVRRSGGAVLEGDILDADFLSGALADFQPHVVVHLAAYAGVRPSIENPRLYMRVNVEGTANVLECMRAAGVSRLAFASSSSVYGNNKKVPFSETDNVDRAISPYAASKKAGEVLCHVYHQLYGMSVACLRFFTVYGPRQRPDLAIHKFTRLIEEGRELPVFGDGSMRRDHTFIADIVDGVVRAVDWTSAAPKYDIFNLGESRPISLSQLISAIEEATGKTANLRRLPMQPGDVQETYANVTHARELLGYEPHTPLEDGLREFVAWYREGRA